MLASLLCERLRTARLGRAARAGAGREERRFPASRSPCREAGNTPPARELSLNIFAISRK